MYKHRRGVTLIELLVVISMIAGLMALLLPAIQAARESARRLRCQSHLHQLGVALHNYHQFARSFPSGISLPSRMLWSGHLLPYLDQESLHARIDIDTSWSDAPNQELCSGYQSVLRCPSSTAPRQLSVQGIQDRVPCNYLACTSGTVTCESGPGPVAGAADSNGVFFTNSRVRLADVLDGSSTTVALGETVFIYRGMGLDHEGMNQFLDHWYVGTTEGQNNEVSEALGSTGVAVNSFALPVFVDEKELDFSSRHPGGAQVVLVDGAVSFISESIDRRTWTALGTRAGGEVAGDF